MMQNGLGHQGRPSRDGAMAAFCPACPQPGINLPEDWKTRYNVCYILVEHSARCELDGYNFNALHIVLEAYTSDAL